MLAFILIPNASLKVMNRRTCDHVEALRREHGLLLALDAREGLVRPDPYCLPMNCAECGRQRLVNSSIGKEFGPGRAGGRGGGRTELVTWPADGLTGVHVNPYGSSQGPAMRGKDGGGGCALRVSQSFALAMSPPEDDSLHLTDLASLNAFAWVGLKYLSQDMGCDLQHAGHVGCYGGSACVGSPRNVIKGQGSSIR